MQDLLSKGSVSIPLYDFKTNSRTGEQTVLCAPVIVFEGILAFYQEVTIAIIAR